MFELIVNIIIMALGVIVGYNYARYRYHDSNVKELEKIDEMFSEAKKQLDRASDHLERVRQHEKEILNG